MSEGVAVYDIETNGLALESKLWSVAIKIDERETRCYTAYPVTGSDGDLSWAKVKLKNAALLVGFNNIGFDAPFLIHKWATNLPAQLDLMIALKLMFSKDQLYDIDRGVQGMPPSLWGQFKLEAFGWRFGNHKIQHEDYSRLSAGMVTYNIQDVDLTKYIYDWCIKQENYPLERVLELEQRCAFMLDRQQRNGFNFDIEAARALAMKMKIEMQKIERKLQVKFRPLFLPDGKEKQAKAMFKRKKWLPDESYKMWTPYDIYISPITKFKNGKIKFPKKAIKWSDTPLRFIISETNATYQPIVYTAFSASSRAHIKRWLTHHYGWIPTVFTAKGNPKVNYETLGEMSYVEGELLKRYLKLDKDMSQLMTGPGSLINSYNLETGCIHHRCDTMGTTTGRMAHSSPNLGQIPSTEGFRSLFKAPPGYSILGADLSAQELRVLAHFIFPYDGGAYAEAVLNGSKDDGTDIHTMNMKAAGLATRDEAKTMIYGILYGSSSTRIGYSLWKPGMEIEFTETEYDEMADKLIRRIDMARKEGNIVDLPDGSHLFPIAKDMYVPFDELLIRQAIYGKRIYDRFIDKTVGYKELQKALQDEARANGYIIGLDGRRLPVRSLHSVLNLAFQGAAAVITKYWMVEFDKRMNNMGPEPMVYNDDYWSNAVIHDEQQLMVKHGLEDLIGTTLRESAQVIGEQLDLHVPQDAEFKYGTSWWDTH